MDIFSCSFAVASRRCPDGYLFVLLAVASRRCPDGYLLQFALPCGNGKHPQERKKKMMFSTEPFFYGYLKYTERVIGAVTQDSMLIHAGLFVM